MSQMNGHCILAGRGLMLQYPSTANTATTAIYPIFFYGVFRSLCNDCVESQEQTSSNFVFFPVRSGLTRQVETPSRTRVFLSLSTRFNGDQRRCSSPAWLEEAPQPVSPDPGPKVKKLESGYKPHLSAIQCRNRTKFERKERVKKK